MKVLTVVQPFGDFKVGDRITDAKAIAAISASEQISFVVRTEEPEPKTDKEAK